MNKTKLLIVAHNNLGTSLSGGDQIFLNLIRHAPHSVEITVVGSAETNNLLPTYHLTPSRFFLSAPENNIPLNTKNLVFHQLIRFGYSLKFFFSHLSLFRQTQFIYTASDFPSDSVFGILTKLFFFRVVWIAGFYLFAPSPLSPDSPYRTTKHAFRGLVYYLGQLPIYMITRAMANFVAVTSTPDTHRFPQKTLVIQGGVDLPLQTRKNIPVHHRQYDAVFLGRLHAQKGVLLLVDIWKLVTKIIPQARLAIIGDGELKSVLITKIKALKLSQNIKLLGFLVGTPKEKVFQNSKIVVHPATYDSGGMAAAEAMAWGLPGVSFDLAALKTYYPQGMIKTPCFDNQLFSDNIIKLLDDKHLYSSTSSKARELIQKHWTWPHRLRPIYQVLTSHPKRF